MPIPAVHCLQKAMGAVRAEATGLKTVCEFIDRFVPAPIEGCQDGGMCKQYGKRKVY